MSWIKCADKMPPRQTDVLCCSRQLLVNQHEIASYTGTRWLHARDGHVTGYSDIARYTHWQLLPSPPDGDA